MTPPPITKKHYGFDSPLKVKFDEPMKKDTGNNKKPIKNHLENWTFVGQDEKELIKK